MRLRSLRLRPSTVFYVAVAFVATAPAWIVKHPPLQDLPFHLSTLRLIHDHGSDAYGFAGTYELTLGRTEYLLYYLLGNALAYVVGVKAANVALVSAYLGGMPLAMRALLRALGRDERLCLFAVPLGVNVMFCMGLLPFVLGFPLMLVALAAAARHFERPTLESGLALGVLAVLTFFEHVLPFALFGVGCIALFPWGEARKWLKSAAPLAAGLALVGWWMLTKAGGTAMGALKNQAPFAPPDSAIDQFRNWSINVFHDTSDEFWAVALAGTAVVALALSLGDRDRSKPVARGWALLPVVCAAGYFKLGDHLGDVWMFGQRFAVPLLLTMVPLLRIPSGARGWAVTAAATAVAVLSTVNVCKHFVQFEREEVGDFEDAIDAMEPRKHVAGLIFDNRSQIMQGTYAPYLHFVSYYQVEKGGVVQFSYVGFPHWPVQYKEGAQPPQGPTPRLRWEWTPNEVGIGELYPYYDYVLVRGDGFRPPPGTYHPRFRGRRWTVWEKDGSR